MCILYFLGFVGVVWLLHKYMAGTACKLRKDLKEKVIFITGANSGIGKETARLLAEMGATLVIACRDTIKGQIVVDALNKISKAYLIKLDLSDLDSVKKCAEDFKKFNISKIDILINNAGVAGPQTYTLTKQGHELQFGTNHLGHFLLTELLVPYLQKADQGRVINISSQLHDKYQLNLKDLNNSQYSNSKLWSSYYNMQAYGYSKLSNILHAMEISKKHGIKGCSLHPGVVRTEIFNNLKKNILIRAFYMLLIPFYYIFTKNSVQGSQTTIYCVLEDYDKLIDGAYYFECKQRAAKNVSQQLAQKLWEISEEKVKAYLQK